MFVRVELEVRLDNTGNLIEVPGLLIPGGFLTPLLEYFIEKARSRSPSWMDKVLRSVRLFCYYIDANPSQRDTRALFTGFTSALLAGTCDIETGDDPSGLFWGPRRGPDRDGVVTDLTQFFDWMGQSNPIAANINPLALANAYEARWNAAARLYRRERALLGHLWSNPGADKLTRRHDRVRAPKPKAAEPPAFPEDRFVDLITNGFKVGERVDHRSICITLLMHGAGFRVSEPFHLYVHDVAPDPTNPRTALVAIHHPSAGYAPDGWRDPTAGGRGQRRAYLAAQYGLRPRDEIRRSLHAGWKGGLYDADNYKMAHWFAPWYGEVFLYHWNRYMEQLVHVKRNHPFLFVNMRRGEVGGIFKLGNFLSQHAAACRRIGLEPRKELGTTPHGHRHAYGQRAEASGLDTKVIQVMLHHASEDSQKVYTEPGSAEVTQALANAHDRLGQNMPERFSLQIAGH